LKEQGEEMPEAIQAKCPGCQKVLRIPANWIGQAIRCKHCGTTVQARIKSGTKRAEAASAWNSGQGPDERSASLTPDPCTLTPGDEPAHLFALGDEGGAGPVILRRPRRHSRGERWVSLLISLCLLGGLAVGLYFFREPLSRLKATLAPFWPAAKTEEGDIKAGSEQLLPAGTLFPRRALVVSVNNYLYANPTGYGAPGRKVHALLDRIVGALHIPPDQALELSDFSSGHLAKLAAKSSGQKEEQPIAAAEASAALPLKPVIEKTISEFLETSRPQDRIILLFLGHVVEIGAEAFLVPLEGELTVKESLIPLAWLYERLERCKARQKLLIIDTCRLDPGRGLERPGSGPMKAKLDALLQKPPAGVQLWSACVEGQYSYEADGGSIFLDRLLDALSPKVLQKIQHPDDPLPVELMAEEVNRKTAAEVEAQIAIDGKLVKQTPRLVGQEPPDGAHYDKTEPLPPPLEIRLPPLPAGGVAKGSDVRGILQEIELPPIKIAREQIGAVAIDQLIPFSAEVLQAYRPDYGSIEEIGENPDKFPLRVKTLEAVKLLRQHFTRDARSNAGSLRETFAGASNDKIKAEILKEQMRPAKVLGDLMEMLDDLRKAGEERDKEPSKRWQAHYDYVLAELLARTAYVHEYNLMLGKIRKDELPPLEKGETGYRLSSREKLQSTKEVKDMAAEANKIFAKLAKQRPGTPWEILAKRERLNALGLEWQPTR
jgi:hypothetical protein